MSSSPPSRWSTAELRAAGGRLLRGLPSMGPALLIVGLLACVLVPLPTVLVDLLLSGSLAGAVLLLVASIRVRKTSEFLDFPSLLLLITLFRLALNVSTTRLILSQADAGRVVDAFANFVVRGDLLVGVVMFGIVTVIQYLVIARGAERVAEVAARFALDGMPGHQAAIDADLRAKAISPQEAAQRRARLTERSNFYGAMDGAVRFVKGDAVAGLVIVGINVIGGVAVGSTRMGYTWLESLDVYGRLTIGDGLLAQIPALLVSLAAGVLVSRVDRESDAPGVEPRRFSWLDPAMLVVPAVLLGALATVPGMPWLAFSTTSVILGGLALLYASRLGDLDPAGAGGRRMRVVIGERDRAAAKALAPALPSLGQRLADELGIEAPVLSLATSPALGPDHFMCEIEGRVVGRGRWDVETAGDSRRGDDARVVAVFLGLREAGPELLDLQGVATSIERARAVAPLETRLGMTHADERDVLRIMRVFARERLPVPGVSTLMRCMAEGEVFRDPEQRRRWPEEARMRLASHWLPALLEALEGRGEVDWVRPTPDLEDQLLARSDVDADGVRLRLAAPARRALVEQLCGGAATPAVITSPRARAVFAALVDGHRPQIVVLSTAEFDAARSERPSGDEIRWVDV